MSSGAEAQARRKLYEGKAKIVWSPGPADRAHLASLGRRAGAEHGMDAYVVEFKDDATAFDGKKKGRIDGKGRSNALISAALFELLERAGVPTHFIGLLGEREMLVRQLTIIPVEVVVRNVAAGSLAKRLGLEEGTALSRPILELYYKSDALGDPMVNRYHVAAMGWATAEEMDRVEDLALRANAILSEALAGCGLRLIDFKLEFGRTAEGEVILGDEISPDTCRLWDAETNEKLDKDRFRRDLGGVEDAYQEVLRRVTVAAGKWRSQVTAPGVPPTGAAPRARARVFVTLKKTVLDPQGAAVENALKSLGYDEVRGTRVGKFIVLDLDKLSPERVDEMCRRLLANPVIEDYHFEMERSE